MRDDETSKPHGPLPLEALDQITVRALCDAGYLPLARYLELCEAKGWVTDLTPALRRRKSREHDPHGTH